MKKRVFYVLGQIDRIGQLVEEMFWLCNLYHPDKYDITVITFPPATKPQTNMACYEIVMRRVNVLHTENGEFIWRVHKNIDNPELHAIHETENGIYVLIHPSALRKEFLQKTKGQPHFFFNLDESDIERGKKLRESFGIPNQAPIVTLHVREGGYLPELSYHSYRDADVYNYLPAIEYLKKQGFYVVRLGDKGMKKLPDLGPQVIDAPFHKNYTNFVEPYFIAVSRFYVGVTSGPWGVARGFGVSILDTNKPLLGVDWGLEGDLFIPKKYYSRKLKRYLTYEEIICSALPDYYKTEYYENANVELHENSAEEILRAIVEMNERINGTYYGLTSGESRKTDQLYKEIQQKGHRYRKNRFDTRTDFYSMYWSKIRISNEFVKINPYFMETDPCKAELPAVSFQK